MALSNDRSATIRFCLAFSVASFQRILIGQQTGFLSVLGLVFAIEIGVAML
jgi:hypothetical protein